MASPPSDIAGTLLFPNQFIGAGSFTFSVPQAGSTFAYTNEPGAPGYQVLNAGQTQRFTAAIAAWDRLIAPTFTQTDDLTNQGFIRVAFTDYSGITDNWGYAYTPPFNGGTPSARSGDIWINLKYNSGFAAGSYDYASLLHEIGHTLGLDHPHDVAAYPAAWDNGLYTVMSYKDDFANYRWEIVTSGSGLRAVPQAVFQSTPMVLDIAAVQQRYGADPATAAGNDVYAFGQDTPFVMSIYDAGGIDTIDLTSHTRGSVIDLTPGAYSSIAQFSAQAQIAYWQDYYSSLPSSHNFIASVFGHDETYTWTDNLGIAFSTIIENVKGGSGADAITGNDAANVLEGFGGNDVINGGAGGDTLWGGAGDDTLIGAAGWDIHIGGDGVDTVQFEFSLSSGGAGAFGGGLFIGGNATLNYVAENEITVFTDGTIDIRDNDPLIDDLYYYGHNIDVWNARVDADAHYKNHGWKEGRNPNAWFDTNAYLAAYADARSAANGGMDPVTHYLTIGWKKGYDPSVRFDTSSYLAAYADVAASGVNPLVHYLQFGMAQYRENFADGSMLT